MCVCSFMFCMGKGVGLLFEGELLTKIGFKESANSRMDANLKLGSNSSTYGMLAVPLIK